LPLPVNCHRYFAVVPRDSPEAPFLVRRRYLFKVLWPIPAAPLAVRRKYLTVVFRSVPRLLPVATLRRRIRRITHGR
jgi:hypothetical protein